MERTAISIELIIGLVVALSIHALVVIGLAWWAFVAPEPLVESPRVTVNLATEVGLEATAPDPVPESRAAIAPTLSDSVGEDAESADAPEVVERTPPPPPRRETRRPTTQTPPQRERSRPDRTPPKPKPRPSSSASRGGGSQIGENFLEGAGSSNRTDETRAPAATFGRRERAALSSAITRQLRPHWNAPTGVDAEKLISIVSWRLNEDGTLRGRPSCHTQNSSITPSNQPQAALHCERAIRAVQLAAPFRLPEQFYSRWDDLEWQFDRRL